MLIDILQKRPAHITNREFRFYALLKVVTVVGLMTHFLWIFLFAYLDIFILTYINILSVGVFILAFYLNQKGKFFLSITVGILEVIAHQLICSTLIGVDVGFQYYIIIACMLPFLLPKGRDLLKLILLFSCIVAFLYIEYFIQKTVPIYVLQSSVVMFLGYSNIILAFSFLGIWGVYFSIAILTTESKLEIEKQKSEKLLGRVKKKGIELERKNKAIRSSINYSEKIQRSILPTMVEVQGKISNSFVYYEPKDIIGGDFYWYYTNEKYSYIAAIDCTGHGVPGALMSMTIYSLLNEIMLKEMLTDPGEILGLLHQKVNISLQQQKGDEYSQDGCDAILCRLDLVNHELVFSGAQNDLFVHNGNELKVFRADKQSIGGLSMLGKFDPIRNFKSQTIPISNNDLIVLATDGIPDQLNKNDVAFGINEFERLMEEMYSNNPVDIKKTIESRVENWKEGVQQQDDLLLFGFKYSTTGIQG